jgi:hypothetical protein
MDLLNKYLVCTAAGVYAATQLPAEGDLAVWFHREIMGRDDAELAAERARAYILTFPGLAFEATP